MSGSEAAADTVEKVKAVILPIIREQTGANDADDMWWMSDYATDYANALIAAFPQLALEGREEWANAWGKQPIQTVLEKHARDANDSYGVPLLKRAFWEQPWSEVES